MKFKRKYTVIRSTPPSVIPFDPRFGTEDEQRAELRQSVVTKLHIDKDTYVHVLIPFVDCGRDELVAHLPELIGVSVILNARTGEVTIDIRPEAIYQVVAAEITVLDK